MSRWVPPSRAAVSLVLMVQLGPWASLALEKGAIAVEDLPKAVGAGGALGFGLEFFFHQDD